MRLDKYLKVSRIYKRREVAKEIISSGRVYINGRKAKASSEVNIGDIIMMDMPYGVKKIEVIDIKQTVSIKEAPSLYRVLEGDKNDGDGTEL